MKTGDLWFRVFSGTIIAACLYLMAICWVGPRWVSPMITWLQPHLGRSGAAMAVVVLFAVVPILVAYPLYLAVDEHLRARRQGDGETRCRRCGHILRGLSQPRCPECGEQI